MAVEFIIGRAGTGKTRRCLDAIVDRVAADPLSEKVVWIVPKQATFQTQRLLALDERLAGYCNVRVLGFDQLARETIHAAGGLGGAEVTPLGRQMVIGHLLRVNEEKLTFFRATARQPGLAAEVSRAFTEFEQAGRDLSDPEPLFASAQLADPQRDDTAQDAALRAKVADLQTIHRAYADYLGAHRVDPAARMKHVPALIEADEALRGATVFVDEFHDFTGLERLMLVALARTAANVHVTLCLDPAHPVVTDPRTPLTDTQELGVFHRTARAYQRLRFSFSQARVQTTVTTLDTPRRFAAPALVALEKHLLSPGDGSLPLGDVRLVTAPGIRGQVEAAARQIKTHLAAGCRLRDVAVLVRDIEPYQEILNAVFAEHRLPYFIDRRRTAAHHPLVRAVRAVMRVAVQRWPTEAIVTLAKTGLASLSGAEADLLDDYLLQHRITPDGWANEETWNYRRELQSDDADDPAVRLFNDDDVAAVDAARSRLRKALAPVVARDWATGETVTVRQRVLDLYAVLDRLGVPAALLNRIRESDEAGEIEARDEHRQVWENFTALLDALVDLLGSEPISAQAFAGVLDVGLESFDLAITPPTVDQVLVGTVDRTRTPPLRACIVLGLNDGEFPRTHREDSVLTDRDRRQLADRGIDVEADSERRQLDEIFLGYIAFTRASNWLTLVRSRADDAGNDTNASDLWLTVLRLFDTQNGAAIKECCDTVATPRQLVSELLAWAQKPAAQRTEDVDMAAVYDRLVRHEADDELSRTRDRAWPALLYDNKPALSPALARELFKAPLKASVSRLESFTRCPFQHFARYGLALLRRPDDDVTQIDLGRVYHAVLDNLVRKLVVDNVDFADAAAVTPAAVTLAARLVAQQLRGQIMLSSARNRYVMTRIEHTIRLLLAAQQEVSRVGTLRPRWTELDYGDGESLLPALRLRTPKGAAVTLRGKIDRIDAADDGTAVVIDYKLNGATLDLDEVYYGLSLQLLAYLLVLREGGETLFGRSLRPAAAFYVRLGRKIEAANPADAPQPGTVEFNFKTKPRGVIDRRHLHVIDPDIVDGGKSDSVSAWVTQDGSLSANCDTLEADDFDRLLRHVEILIGKTADQVLAGDITPRPFLLGSASPCPRCEMRAVCRFDLSTNSYHRLQTLKRPDVLKRLREESGDADA